MPSPNDPRGAGAGESDEKVRQLLDPHDDRASIIDGDRILVVPSQVLGNIRLRMERIDLDPATSWSLEEVMSMDEMAVVFDRLYQGPLFVSATADFARQILGRWPAELVGHPIPPHARIDAFLPGITVDPLGQDLGRRVLNRALASTRQVDTHPELDGPTPQELMSTWMAVVFWFAIKSGLLHQR